MILLGPKKIPSFIVDAMSMHDKEYEECHGDVPSVGRQSYIRIKL